MRMLTRTFKIIRRFYAAYEHDSILVYNSNFIMCFNVFYILQNKINPKRKNVLLLSAAFLLKHNI